MATLYITEYATVATLPNHTGQVPQEPPLAEQTVSIGATAVQSAAFQSGTRLVRLHTDAICSLVIGASPVATAGNGRFAAGQTEFRGVPEGRGFSVSVITNS